MHEFLTEASRRRIIPYVMTAARVDRVRALIALISLILLVLGLAPVSAAGRKLLDQEDLSVPVVVTISEVLVAPLSGWAHREDVKRFAKKKKGGRRRHLLVAQSRPLTRPVPSPSPRPVPAPVSAVSAAPAAVPASFVPRPIIPSGRGVTSRLPPAPPVRFRVSDRDPRSAGTPIVDQYMPNTTAVVPKSPPLDLFPHRKLSAETPWVELWVAEALDLGGWSLSIDGGGGGRKWAFPPSTLVAEASHVLILLPLASGASDGAIGACSVPWGPSLLPPRDGRAQTSVDAVFGAGFDPASIEDYAAAQTGPVVVSFCAPT